MLLLKYFNFERHSKPFPNVNLSIKSEIFQNKKMSIIEI